ncbi:unnamed protein product [Candida verbasci]|uniref:UBX domain-containing protein n=1 Tax=Candida verbasci TaxID=1227364 RepID=A0A9W4TVN2_9ASCO|nr:unnamed protein product [Candida verbasci]
MNQLTSEQQEKIDTFKAVSGIEDDENLENIINLLSINDFNLNNAISTYLDSGFESLGNTPIAEGMSSSIDVHDDAQNEQILHSRNGRHFSPNEIVNLQNQLFMDSFIPKLPKAPLISNGWQLEVGIHSSIIHERERREKEELEKKEDNIVEKTESISLEPETKKPSNPLNSLWIILLIIPKSILSILVTTFKFLFNFSSGDDDDRLSKTFNFEKFHPNYKFLDKFKEIKDNFNLHESNFNDVHSFCQREYNWLLVILVNDSTESQNFINSLLHDSTFNRFFNKSNGDFKETQIFVNNVERSPESLEIGQTYKVRKIPHVLLIGNVSPSHEVMASISIVYKSNLSKPFITDEELPSTISKILKNFNKYLDKFNPQLVSARFDRQEMEFSRMIRQQQEDAYNESLIKDQQKKVEKQQQEKLQKEMEYKTKWKQFNLLHSIKNVDSYISDDGIRIAIKLPNGKRLIEKFNKSINIIEFYFYIEVKLFVENLLQEQQCSIDEVTDIIDELIDNLDINEEEHLSSDEYYETFGFNFELIQPYPKKVIEPTTEFIGDCKEFKGANFLVEYKDEEEEEDEEEDEQDEEIDP